MLGIGALVSVAWRAGAQRWITATLVGILVVLGALRTRSRDLVWHDQGTLLRETVLDAPRSYAAHLALARFLEDSGSAGDAARAYRNAVAIRPSLVGRDRALADEYRRAGLCRPAVRLYRRALIIVPDDSAMRAALMACGDSGSSPPVR
jgi:tetratricopeptide (TPR) repeat protein